MKYAQKTYKLAAGTFCTDHRGHAFSIITNEEVKKQIRKQYPNMTAALWQCYYCDRVTESM